MRNIFTLVSDSIGLVAALAVHQARSLLGSYSSQVRTPRQPYSLVGPCQLPKGFAQGRMHPTRGQHASKICCL
jgi:hypothetical protein